MVQGGGGGGFCGGGGDHGGARVAVAVNAVWLGLHQRLPHLLGTRLQIEGSAAAAESVVAQWGGPADKPNEMSNWQAAGEKGGKRMSERTIYLNLSSLLAPSTLRWTVPVAVE